MNKKARKQVRLIELFQLGFCSYFRQRKNRIVMPCKRNTNTKNVIIRKFCTAFVYFPLWLLRGWTKIQDTKKYKNQDWILYHVWRQFLICCEPKQAHFARAKIACSKFFLRIGCSCWKIRTIMEVDPVSPKTKHTFKTQQIYLNSHGNKILEGSWKKKFVAELTVKSKKDRFQKIMQSRNIVCIYPQNNYHNFLFVILLPSLWFFIYSTEWQ